MTWLTKVSCWSWVNVGCAKAGGAVAALREASEGGRVTELGGAGAVAGAGEAETGAGDAAGLASGALSKTQRLRLNL